MGGFNMKLGKSKANLKAKNGKKIVVNLLATGGLVVLVGGLVMAEVTSAEKVYVVGAVDNIFPNGLITKDNTYRKEILKDSYDTEKHKPLLWEDLEEALNTYATIYTHNGGTLIEDTYRETKPLKNAWLQEVSKSNLVITVPYQKTEAFGNILTPGDHVAINISYTKEEMASSDMFTGMKVDSGTVTLFPKAKIIDLLNGAGNSIYDYYTDLLNLPIEERDKLLRDESFLANVSPASMILEVTKSEFDEYSDLRHMGNLTYTYGLHRREEGDTVLDQFQDLSRQITNAQTQILQGE